MCFLSENIYDYVNVSQGKITIPNVDDGEECLLTDVSHNWIYHPGHKERMFPRSPVNSTPVSLDLFEYKSSYYTSSIGDVDHFKRK